MIHLIYLINTGTLGIDINAPDWAQMLNFSHSLKADVYTKYTEDHYKSYNRMTMSS